MKWRTQEKKGCSQAAGNMHLILNLSYTSLLKRQVRIAITWTQHPEEGRRVLASASRHHVIARTRQVLAQHLPKCGSGSAHLALKKNPEPHSGILLARLKGSACENLHYGIYLTASRYLKYLQLLGIIPRWGQVFDARVSMECLCGTVSKKRWLLQWKQHFSNL